MKYKEITIRMAECGVEPVLAVLSSIGIDNANVVDPRDAEEIMKDKETYEWDYISDSVTKDLGKTPEIHLYFGMDEADAKEKEIEEALAKLKKNVQDGAFGSGVDFGELSLTSEERDDSDWKDKWKEYFKPKKISESIVIKPTWEEYEPAEGEKVIEIDPGMAFGTGTHETTSMCIGLLEKYIKGGESMLDAGCGSGILEIAAVLLGAKEARGIDIDPESVRVANENIELNGVSSQAEAEYGDITKGAGSKADVIAANLMAELLCMIAGYAAECLNDGGIFISSGILTEKEEMVRKAYEDAGLEVVDAVHKGEWCALAARRK